MRYPRAVDPKRVGKYPAAANAGGGYVWDEVLEYRVWCHPENGAPDVADGNDYYYAFATYPKARAFSLRTPGAEEPLALVRQRQYIDEPRPGRYVHVKRARITEWPVEFLGRPRRDRHTIPDFLSADAPPNRLDILRGNAPRRSRMPENKTKPNNASIEAYLASRASEEQLADCRQLMKLLGKVTRQPPKMWGPSIVGYGSYSYTYESGRTGEAPLAGFAIRGRDLVVYVAAEGEGQRALLSRIGKHKMGKSCLYFRRLADLDRPVLEKLVAGSVAEMKQRYG